MKKLIFSLIILTSITFISCGSDDADDAAANSASGVIGIGGWRIVSDSSKTEPLTMCDLASGISFGDTRFSDDQVDQNEEENCVFLPAKRSNYRVEGDKIILLTDAGAIEPTETVMSFKIEGDIFTLTETSPTSTRVRTFKREVSQ